MKTKNQDGKRMVRLDMKMPASLTIAIRNTIAQGKHSRWRSISQFVHEALIEKLERVQPGTHFIFESKSVQTK